MLTGVTPEMKIFREETFGPVAPLFRFKTDAEVVELANRTEFGLASYFYSRDIGRIWRVAEALEYGMVGVNTGLITTEVAPFGGVKQSGLGTRRIEIRDRRVRRSEVRLLRRHRPLGPSQRWIWGPRPGRAVGAIGADHRPGHRVTMPRFEAGVPGEPQNVGAGTSSATTSLDAALTRKFFSTGAFGAAPGAICGLRRWRNHEERGRGSHWHTDDIAGRQDLESRPVAEYSGKQHHDQHFFTGRDGLPLFEAICPVHFSSPVGLLSSYGAPDQQRFGPGPRRPAVCATSMGPTLGLPRLTERERIRAPGCGIFTRARVASPGRRPTSPAAAS